MKNFYLTSILAISLLSTNLTTHAAEWEQIKSLPATNTFFIARNGNMLLADYQFDYSGGIYISEDKGTTWTKTAAPDYMYNKFIENDEYIFAAGAEAKIGRSADGGKTWETLSYARAFEEVMSSEYTDYTVCYAMTMHNDKLFIGDFSGGGIMYSEDNGETWQQTDIETLRYGEEDSKLGQRPTENIYNLVSYNGDLYAFGVYFVFRLIEETMQWETIRNDSNFMAISTIYKDKMCCGRSVMNESFDVPFILTLDNSGEWGELPRPEGFMDNNIRAMHAEGDNLYVGMQLSGMYFTDNEGENWYNISDGLVKYGDETYCSYDSPLSIDSDDEYIYVAMYRNQYSDGANVSGLYRYKKAELPTSSIKSIDNRAAIISKAGNFLRISGNVEKADLYDLNGRKINAAINNSTIDLSELPSGVYIYKVQIDGKLQTGKLVK